MTKLLGSHADDISVDGQTDMPSDFRSLIWTEFYTSRGRGIALDIHSPWLARSKNVYFIVARDAISADLAGGLVIKRQQSKSGAWYALVGYVCVTPGFRNRGVSKLLMQAAIGHARNEGCRGVMLWTQSPQIYFGSGFVCDARDVLNCYASLTIANSGKDDFVSEALCAKNWDRGWPPFATSVTFYSSDKASVLVMETAAGPAVAEWTGEDKAVISLLGSIFEGPWWLNALSNDSLLAELKKIDAVAISEIPSALMVLPFDGIDPRLLGPVRILDRI